MRYNGLGLINNCTAYYHTIFSSRITLLLKYCNSPPRRSRERSHCERWTEESRRILHLTVERDAALASPRVAPALTARENKRRRKEIARARARGRHAS